MSARYVRGNAAARDALPEATDFGRWRFAPRDGRGTDGAYAIERFKRERNLITFFCERFMAGLAVGFFVGFYLKGWLA